MPVKEKSRHRTSVIGMPKRKNKKIKWPEDLPAADRLKKALEILKTLKKA